MTASEDRLARMLVKNSYLHQKPGEPPFRLASGKESSFYFDCQRTTSSAEALPFIGEVFFSRLLPAVRSVGGLTRGADPIALAIAFHSAEVGRCVNAFSVRKDQKDHGTQRWIEGWADSGDAVALVDDVITTGRSVIQASERCREAGVKILQVLVLVDREEGGLDSIRKQLGPSVPVVPVFRRRDLDQIWEENGRQSDAKRNRSTSPAV